MLSLLSRVRSAGVGTRLSQPSSASPLFAAWDCTNRLYETSRQNEYRECPQHHNNMFGSAMSFRKDSKEDTARIQSPDAFSYPCHALRQARHVHGSSSLKTNGIEGSGQQFASSRPTKNDTLASPGGAAAAYTALAAVHAAVAIPHFLFPHTAAEFIFAAAAQPHDVLHETLHRINGVGHLAAATSFWTLKEAAEGDAEEGRNHVLARRMSLGLMTFSGVSLALHLANADLIRPSALAVAAGAMGLSFAVPAYFYRQTTREPLNLSALRGIGDDLGKLVHNKNVMAAMYSLLTVAFLGAGAGYIAAPEATLTGVFSYAKGADVMFLWRVIGSALLLLPTWTFSLKEAADNGRLAATGHSTLNTGLLVASLAHVAILGNWYMGGDYGTWIMPAVLGTWATALGASIGGLSTRNPRVQVK